MSRPGTVHADRAMIIAALRTLTRDTSPALTLLVAEAAAACLEMQQSAERTYLDRIAAVLGAKSDQPIQIIQAIETLKAKAKHERSRTVIKDWANRPKRRKK